MIVHARRLPATDPRVDQAREALVAARHALDRARRALRDAAGWLEYEPGAMTAFSAEAQATANALGLVDQQLADLAD